MHSRIDKVEMKPDDHRTVTASGRVTWDPDEASATFVVTIVQLKPGGHIVYATGRSARTLRPSDDWWEAEAVVLDPGDQLQFNLPVTGWTMASVEDKNGESEPYPWETDNLTIDRAPVAVAP